MSDKWIPYGPGCAIDPDVVKNTLRYCADWDDSGPAIEIARKSITALQQREERKKKAVAILHEELLSIESGQGGRGSASAMIEAIAALEGTDGE